MKASIGRMVIVQGIHSNGATEHPAVITRVWSGHDTDEAPVCVNLTVFPDSAPPMMRSSVPLYSTAALAANQAALVAYWPERV